MGLDVQKILAFNLYGTHHRDSSVAFAKREPISMNMRNDVMTLKANS